MIGTDILAHLDKIADTSSRTEKEELVERAISDPLFKRVVKYAYDPFITFGLTPPKAVGSGRQQITEDSKVWGLLDGLASRAITGGDAQETVREWLVDVLDEANSQLLWRILSKDLRCGITAKTINKVVPGTIPVFDVMLAHKFEEKRVKAWPVAVEPKLDGLRTIGLVKGHSGGFFSRTGKPFPALEHLVEPVAHMLAGARAAVQNAETAAKLGINEKVRQVYWKLLGGDGNPCIAIDGEAVAGNFNETTGAVRRKDELAGDAVLNVFDVLPYAIFTGDRQEIALKYSTRRTFTQFVLSHAAKEAPIRLVPRYFANSHDEIQSFYQTFRDRGLEGAIVKPLDGTYVKKRSHAWLKMKNEETVDVYITGAFEGTGKYEGQLGGIIVDVDGVEVRVGGGFRDDERVTLWEAYQCDLAKVLGDEDVGRMKILGCELLGRMVEVEFHEKTPAGLLRHPRFVAFRDDKDDILKKLEAA